MEILLVIFYIVIFSFVILKTPLFKSNTLTKQYILIFFLIKVLAGFSYTYIFNSIINGNDIFVYFRDGEIVFSALKDNPLYYLQLVFGPSDLKVIPAHLASYIHSMGYWFDQANFMMVRLNALFHLFSFGHFGVHVVFISFLSLIGIYNIYRFFEPSFNGDKLLLITFLFFTPSIVFWYSGLHKEAVVIIALGFILNGYQHLIQEDFRIRYLAAIIFGSLLLMLVRFFVFAVFFPGFLALFISYKLLNTPRVFIFSSVYLGFALFAICLHFYSPDLSPFMEMMARQQHFFNTPGNSSYAIPPLDGTIVNMITKMPQAFLNSLIHPIPKNCINSSFLCFVAMAESYIILAALIFGAFRIKWRRFMDCAVVNYCLFTSITLLILMGLIVNNAGALVRYKSIVLPFLMIGIYSATQQKKKSKISNQFPPKLITTHKEV